MQKADISKLNKAIFWDVHVASLDIEAHCRFIIERVLTRGGLLDWEILKKMYGKQRIRDEALAIRSLDRKTVSFLSTYFNLEKKAFRCSS